MAPDSPPHKQTAPEVPTPTSTNDKKSLLCSPPPMHPPPPRSISSSTENCLPPGECTTLLHHPPQISPYGTRICSSHLSPSPFPDENDETFDEWTVPHRSTLYMIYLSLIMAGIQFSWSVELAYISPYLLSLGLPKSTLSLVWVAGPLSGVIGQPLIGMLSDRSKFKWGRRRVFIVCSTVGVVLGFIGMGRTREVVAWWTGRRDWQAVQHAVVGLAIASLIVLDVAINAGI